MLKEEKIEIVRQMMTNHVTLPEKLFDKDKKVYPKVRKLLYVSDYVQEQFLSALKETKVRDIVLSGSMCSYIYNDDLDLDLFIVVDKVIPDNESLSLKLLSNLNNYINILASKPFFYTHPIDHGILLSSKKMLTKSENYSLLTETWGKEPQRGEFSFTPEDLFSHYCKFSADFHKYVDDLPKTNEGFLTYDSAQNLQKYMQTIKINAFGCKSKEAIAWSIIFIVCLRGLVLISISANIFQSRLKMQQDKNDGKN